LTTEYERAKQREWMAARVRCFPVVECVVSSVAYGGPDLRAEAEELERQLKALADRMEGKPT
jgi:hypothetical protein